MQFQRVTPEIVRQLEKIVGPGYVVFDDPAGLEPFSHDKTPEPHYAHMPEALVRPRSAEEVAAILRLANEVRIPVTPRGAGTGLSGGAVPLSGGIVLSVDRMDRILEIDAANLMCLVEPGVITNRITRAAAEVGLFYAGYPLSEEDCYIGGNVAENAGGAKAVKYGVTGRYVMGLEVVTPTGRIVRLGGKLIKDVTGYNLVPLLVGSEGTLGVFTKITLRLLPAPKASLEMLCRFDSVAAAIGAVPKMMAGGGIVPTAIEFVQSEPWQAACDWLGRDNPVCGGTAMLLISVDGPEADQVARHRDILAEQCRQAGADLVVYSGDDLPSAAIWKIRSSIAKALGDSAEPQTNEDLVVPISAIPALLAGVEQIASKYGVRAYSYGHAGDGNVHTRIFARPDWPPAMWYQTLPKVLADLYDLTAGLGGRLSGEHGIGHKRKAYIGRFLSPDELELMRSIKRAWDPNNILNPGKVFEIAPAAE